MELNYNVTGAEHKKLVTAISEILNLPAKYLGAPSFAYEVGGVTIDKNGTVSCTDDEAEKLSSALYECGFSVELPEIVDSLVIEYPKTDMTDAALENLHRLVASKESLIKKALGADALPIEVTEDKIRFPWFKGFPDGDAVNAYAHFTGALIGMAKSQTRITATEKPVENEKYAFRCFLLRLGFIGAEYKEHRKILLRNLSGSSAFKSASAEE